VTRPKSALCSWRSANLSAQIAPYSVYPGAHDGFFVMHGRRRNLRVDEITQSISCHRRGSCFEHIRRLMASDPHCETLLLMLRSHSAEVADRTRDRDTRACFSICRTAEAPKQGRRQAEAEMGAGCTLRLGSSIRRHPCACRESADGALVASMAWTRTRKTARGSERSKRRACWKRHCLPNGEAARSGARGSIAHPRPLSRAGRPARAVRYRAGTRPCCSCWINVHS
jgi:hypothetical protein